MTAIRILLFALTTSAIASGQSETARIRTYWLTDTEPETVVMYDPLLVFANAALEHVLMDSSLRRLVQQSAEASAGARPILDEPAYFLQTNERDSIWNPDGQPIKPFHGEAVKDGSREILANGRRYRVTRAEAADVIRLLQKPEGTIPLHRTHAPVAGAEQTIRAIQLLLNDRETEKSIANLELGVVSLSAVADRVPFRPQQRIVYDPANSGENRVFALYVVNRADRPLTIDTSSIYIRAIGCEGTQTLAGDIFGNKKQIDVPAGESTIVVRVPWLNLLDAGTLERNQQADDAIGLGFGGAPDPNVLKRRSLHWTWDLILRGPTSPIYDRFDKLACATSIGAEFHSEDQVVRSRPMMVIVASKLEDEQKSGKGGHR